MNTSHKTLLFTHDRCDDGFACYWVLSKFHELEPVFLNYGVEVDNLRSTLIRMCAGRNVVIADFSFEPDVLVEMAKVSKTLLMLDHHKTALDRLQAATAEGQLPIYSVPTNKGVDVFKIKDCDSQIILDMGRCGSRMVWDYFSVDGPTPRLLSFVDINDRGRADDVPEAHKVIAYLRSYLHDLVQWDRVSTLLETDDGFVAACKQGGAILRAHRQNVANHLAWLPPTQITIHGVDGLVVNGPRSFASELGTELARQSGTFGAVWWWDTNRVKVSLRSIGDTDVATLAETFGGGGHRRASGFESPVTSFLSLLT